MSSIQITGGAQLNGTIIPSGNKNAATKMLCASILTDQKVILHNIPKITDVIKIIGTLRQLGSKIHWNTKTQTVHIDNSNLNLDNFDGRVPLGIRSSVVLIAPLLHRFKKIVIDNEIGGCSLGTREIDPHINLLKSLGARVDQDGHKLLLSINGNLEGTFLWPEYASVTATENAIMAAVLAKGTTIFYNAAAEPHIQDLCHMLVRMGAQIEGIGSNKLIIKGVPELGGAEATVSSDHHEITSFLALGAMTGGRVAVQNALPQHFPLIIREFRKLGVELTYQGDTALVEAEQSFEPEQQFTQNFIPKIEAAPWPYFPADLLPLMVALSLKTKGATRFWNKVHDGGLFWVTELSVMGAKLQIMDPHRIIVLGPCKLEGATVNCPYIIRATVALMMAAMAAEGTSTLHNIDTIHRAHPNFLENLRSLGARIEEISGS